MKVGVLSAFKRAIIPRGTRRIRIPFGLYRGIVVELDLYDRTQLVLGLWERETHRWIRLANQRCQWMIDVGAGRGELCLYFLKEEPKRPVVAVEPSPADRNRMQSNLLLNNVESSAISYVDRRIGPEAEGCVPLDELCCNYASHGFIKIDVDGGETDVLRSGERFLRTGSVDILVETHSAELEQSCFQLLQKLGFRCRIIKNAWWRWIIPENRPVEQNRWIWAEK